MFSKQVVTDPGCD